MSHGDRLPAARCRIRRRAIPGAVLGATAVPALAAFVLCAAGCGSAPTAAPTASAFAGAQGGVCVSSPSAGAAAPAPRPTITAGPAPAAAVAAVLRYWRLVSAHRYRALLAVVTPDSPAAAAVRAGRGAKFWGIAHARVVSVRPAVEPLPPPGSTLEIGTTVIIRPSATSPWSAGRALVFVSLRRVAGSWLVCQSGTGP